MTIHGDGEAELFALIAHTPVATVITDPRLPDNPIVAVNRAFCRLTGYSEEESVGRNCRFLAGPRTNGLGSTALRNAVTEVKPALVELLNYRRDGSSFRNAVMIAPVFGAEGELRFFIGSQMDVTEEVSPPAALRKQRAEDMIASLTPRQQQVLRQMMLGYRNKQIAAQLGIGEKTVKMHRAGLLAKLAVPTSADAVRVAVEAGV